VISPENSGSVLDIELRRGQNWKKLFLHTKRAWLFLKWLKMVISPFLRSESLFEAWDPNEN
jgi:hypothetical protein